jgi:AcrR family transcriptional regulator
LLEAMERLLSQGQSFSALTVETLASEAGIARATFYLRFKDKSALVASLLADRKSVV